MCNLWQGNDTKCVLQSGEMGYNEDVQLQVSSDQRPISEESN